MISFLQLANSNESGYELGGERVKVRSSVSDDSEVDVDPLTAPVASEVATLVLLRSADVSRDDPLALGFMLDLAEGERDSLSAVLCTARLRILLLEGGPIVRSDEIEVPLSEEGKAPGGCPELGVDVLCTAVAASAWGRRREGPSDPIPCNFVVCCGRCASLVKV